MPRLCFILVFLFGFAVNAELHAQYVDDESMQFPSLLTQAIENYPPKVFSVAKAFDKLSSFMLGTSLHLEFMEKEMNPTAIFKPQRKPLQEQPKSNIFIPEITQLVPFSSQNEESTAVNAVNTKAHAEEQTNTAMTKQLRYKKRIESRNHIALTLGVLTAIILTLVVIVLVKRYQANRGRWREWTNPEWSEHRQTLLSTDNDFYEEHL